MIISYFHKRFSSFQRCLLDLKNGRNIYINSLRGIPAVDVAKKIISGQCNVSYFSLWSE